MAEPRPVDLYGQLQVVGGRLCSAAGVPIQLTGMSLFWSQWSPAWDLASLVDTLADHWGCSLVRVAMGVEKGGYLDHPEVEKARVRAVVDAAIAKGIYVIIDWHDHHAEQHEAEAKAFFAEMAAAYHDQPQVLFEIYNEPIDVPWSTVKSYADSVIRAIRATGAGQVVIVGSPHWSQDVGSAADDPISGPNIAYTLHFYAATHKEALRKQALNAIGKGIALFVTEWGTCEASGNGVVDQAESTAWLALLDEYRISWANWSLFDKMESASALKPGSSPQGNWTPGDLTVSGMFVLQHLSERSRLWLAAPHQ
jgi:endoglucanase